MKTLTEIQHSNNEYKLFLAMPGVKKDDVKITIDKSVLNIEAEPKIDGLSNNVVYSEFSKNFRIYKKFTIDTDVLDIQKCEAKVSDGVLTLRLPIKEESKPREIQVTGGD